MKSTFVNRLLEIAVDGRDVMKKLTKYISFAFILIGLSSCSDSHTSLTEDLLDHFDDVTGVLEDLAEGGTVDDAISGLENLSDEGKDLQARMTELGDPDEETESRLEEKFEERMEEGQKKIADLMMKIQKDGKATPELMEAMAGVMPDSK